MEKLFTKYFWIFNLLTLTIVAYFLASGTGEIAAAQIETLLPKGPAKTKKVKTKATRVKKTGAAPANGDDILARNIFDSALGPISRVEAAPVDESFAEMTSVDPSSLPIVPCTDGSLKLAATVASQNDTAWSFASVESGGSTRLYRVGDELNGRTVSGITWRYLFLRGSSDECYMDMFPDPNPPAPTTAPTAQPPAAGEPADGNQYASQIKKVSDTEVQVDRALINDLLADPTKFIREVRVRPNREGGKVNGYKLRRFQQNSPLALMGAQKGDIIHSVNGVELTSVDKALGAYQNMRSVNDLSFGITRNGEPVELKVSIK